MVSLTVFLVLAGATTVPGGDASNDDARAIFEREDRTLFRRAIQGPIQKTREVWTRDDLDALGVRELVDVVRLVPGVHVQRAIDGRYVIKTVGLAGEHRVRVVVDGLNANDPWDERAPLSLPIGLIEKVSVFHRSLLEIHVDTRRARGLRARVSGGSFLSANASAQGGARVLETDLSAALSLSTTQGPALVVEEDSFSEIGFPTAPRGGVRGQLHRADLALNAARELGVGRLELSLQSALVARGPWVGLFDTIDESGGESALKIRGGARWTTDPTWPIAAAVGLEMNQALAERGHQVTPRGFVLADRDGDGVDEVFEDGVLTLERLNALRTRAFASLGFALARGHEVVVDIDARAIFAPNIAIEMNRDLVGRPQSLGPVDGLDLEAPTLPRLWASARITDRVRVGPLSGSLSLGFAQGNEPARDLLDHIGADLAVRYDARPFAAGLDLRRGLILPALSSRYSQLALSFTDITTGGFLGDSEVRPELLHAARAFAEYKRDDLELELGASALHISRAIELIPENGNVELITARGDAASINATVRVRVEYVFLRLAWQRAFYLGDDGRTSLLTDAPQLGGDVGVRLPSEFGELSTWVELVSERRNNARSDLERLRVYRIPGYAMVNASYRSPAFEVGGVELSGFLAVHNLLDHALKDEPPRADRVSGLVPRAGVRLFGGLTLAR